MRSSCLLFFTALFILAHDAEALEIPPRPESYINDYAHIVSVKTKQTLEHTLSGFESKTTNHVVVAAFDGLEGESLEDFSIRLAERWKIGTREKNNGAILLIFKNDRRIRIEVGYGLEGLLTDALCDSIIRNEIVPYFKKGDYDNGVISGVNAIIKAASGEYGPGRASRDALVGIFVLIIFLLIIILSAYVEYRRKKDKYWGASSRGHYHGTWGSHHGGGFGGGGFGGGFGGGGGGFGGGGSSGRW